MECSLDVFEVETRRPIPLVCSTDEDATRAELFYKEFAGEKWVTVKMRKKDDAFMAEIPCTATMNAGKLRFYVRAKAASGEDADNWGTRKKPVEVNIVGETTADPPSLPDADPPNRCAEEVECPPDFPGCKPKTGPAGGLPYGASCSEQNCASGLLCIEGLCESAPSCEKDSDCPGGTECMGGTCGGEGGGGDGGPSGPFKKNWVGIHFAHDFAWVSGDDVCLRANQPGNGFACFERGTTNAFPGTFGPGTVNVNGMDVPAQERQDAQPGTNDRIAGGFSSFGGATMRILASFDRQLLIPNLTLGIRAGFAFNGSPTSNDGTSFLPIHGEARAQYFFGKDPLGKKGLRPYVHAGGGVAQVDAKLPVTAVDCAGAPDANNGGRPRRASQTEFDQCMQRRGEGVKVDLDAYKRLGQSFATIGGGAVFALTPRFGLQLNVNAMLLLGSTGFAIQPSLGGVYGL
jgi:hypothetical protein